jgi:hypothetical protein
MSTNIEGKVVVITGASSGLVESTARHLELPHFVFCLRICGARRTPLVPSRSIVFQHRLPCVPPPRFHRRRQHLGTARMHPSPEVPYG